MKIKYKQVKIPMPHCGDCGEMLTGNNSYVAPYYCSCGTWTMKIDEKATWDFYLVEEKKDVSK